MSRAGVEPTIPVLERPKTVGALDRAAIGNGFIINYELKYMKLVKLRRSFHEKCQSSNLQACVNCLEAMHVHTDIS
jgi:hypothetical protein